MEDVVAVFLGAEALADVARVFLAGDDFVDAVFVLRSDEGDCFAVAGFCAKGVKS